MTSDDPAEPRHSQARSAEIITDPDERARRESRNGLAQYDAAKEIIRQYLDEGRRFSLRTSLLQQLHLVALEGLNQYAGNWRPGAVSITKSRHQPPERPLVPFLVEEMCDYVNDHWDEKSAIHLSAYVMWRLNWIHPFDDGNGRTSRMVSYVVLCIKTGQLLPGENTVAAQIVQNRQPYYDAIEAADEAWRDGERIDVSAMEKLLEDLLANQLYAVYQQAVSEG